MLRDLGFDFLGAKETKPYKRALASLPILSKVYVTALYQPFSDKLATGRQAAGWQQADWACLGCETVL